MIYDIIGDIHGHYDKLINLLEKMGYVYNGKFYQAPHNHKAIFIGDMIDRAKKQTEVLKTVFSMLDNHQAYAIMGNHELNAIAYSIKNDNGDYLRPHNEKNTKQHQAFLDALPFQSDEYHYWINRLYELPLWLELDDAFFIHACAKKNAINTLSPHLIDNKLTPNIIKNIYNNHSTFCALEILLKGVEVYVPEPHHIIDPQGIKRNNIRVAWWQSDLTKPLVQISCSSICDMSGIPPDFQIPITFEKATNNPIFIGHYWLDGAPKPLSKDVICVDYSAGRGDKLVAYQFDGNDPTINETNFIWSDI